MALGIGYLMRANDVSGRQVWMDIKKHAPYQFRLEPNFRAQLLTCRSLGIWSQRHDASTPLSPDVTTKPTKAMDGTDTKAPASTISNKDKDIPHLTQNSSTPIAPPLLLPDRSAGELTRPEIKVTTNWSVALDTHTRHLHLRRVDPYEPEMAFLIPQLFSREEAVRLLLLAEEHGFGKTSYPQAYRGNLRLMTVDHDFVSALWPRIRPFVPAEIVDKSQKVWRPVGLNECLRLSKYHPGTKFEKHCDYEFQRPQVFDGVLDRSMFTVNIYMNSSFSRGHTRFFKSRRTDDILASVKPEPGLCLVFRQPVTAHLLHDGEVVEDGVKYLLRSDVMYRTGQPSDSDC